MDLESLKTELDGKKSQSELKVKIEAREALISELAQKIPDQLNYPHIINQLEAQKKHLRRLKKNYKREGSNRRSLPHQKNGDLPRNICPEAETKKGLASCS